MVLWRRCLVSFSNIHTGSSNPEGSNLKISFCHVLWGQMTLKLLSRPLLVRVGRVGATLQSPAGTRVRPLRATPAVRCLTALSKVSMSVVALTLRHCGKKWGGMTLPSLLPTPNTMEGNMVLITVGDFSGAHKEQPVNARLLIVLEVQVLPPDRTILPEIALSRTPRHVALIPYDLVHHMPDCGPRHLEVLGHGPN